jgi:hypothetical protein
VSVSVGVALSATVLTLFTSLTAAPADPQRALEGYRWAFVVSTALAALSAVVATRISDEDAAATMSPRGDLTTRGRGRTSAPRPA